jgi:hypothetical protein
MESAVSLAVLIAGVLCRHGANAAELWWEGQCRLHKSGGNLLQDSLVVLS